MLCVAGPRKGSCEVLLREDTHIYTAFSIARKFVQTTGKLVRTSGTHSVCFTGSDVLGCKKQTATKVNKNNRDLASMPLEK